VRSKIIQACSHSLILVHVGIIEKAMGGRMAILRHIFKGMLQCSRISGGT